MTTNPSQKVQSQNNVVPFRRRHQPELGTLHIYSASVDSLTVRRHSPKEDVEVVRKVEFDQPVLPYSKKNYLAEYKCWDNMKQRCRRGDGVLDPRFEKFADFMLHMGPIPIKGYSIDRKDSDNPEYSPENSRWASKTLQTRNRGNTVIYTDNTGRAQTAAEWASRPGSVSANTLQQRAYRGWPHHDAIHRPKRYQLKKKQAAQLPSANCDELEALCRQKLREEHKQGFICFQAKDKGMLNKISHKLEAGGIPSLPALALILDEWSTFTIYADKQYGVFKPPVVPTTEYLSRALQAIGNFYLLHLQNIEEEKAEQQRQELLEEQQRAEAQRVEQRRRFIDDYLYSTPDYKRLTDELAWLDSVKKQPNTGMKFKHYVQYAPFHFFLHSGYADEAIEHEPPEQWAERAIADTTQNWPRIIWNQLMADTKEALEILLREEGLQKEAEVAYAKSQ